MRLQPNDVAIRNARGLAYFKLGEFDNAIVDYDAAIRISASEHSLYLRGLAKMGGGDKAGGSADIAAAKAIKSDIAEYYARYGVL